MKSSEFKLLLCFLLIFSGFVCGCSKPKPEKENTENVVTEMDIQNPNEKKDDSEADSKTEEPKSPTLEGPKS